MFSMKKVAMAALLTVGTLFAAGPALAGLYSVEITISNLTDANLAAFDIDVSYDTDLLTFDSYTLTTELGVLDGIEADDYSFGDEYAGYEYVGPGTANISLFSYLDSEVDADFFSGQSDNFTLATLTFYAADTSSLDGVSLSYIDLSDEYGDDLSYTVDGTNISVSAVPVPGAVWLLGSGLLGLIGLRRKSAA